MDLNEKIKTAEKVADRAEALRQDLRWNVKPGKTRNRRIETALEQIRKAMVPIRSGMGSVVQGRVTPGLVPLLQDVSARLQYERKQLKKMLR